LIQAGIANLKNEDEAKEAIAQVANLQAGRNPLSNRKDAIEKVGILKFFQNITPQECQTSEIDKIIERLGKS
jgi:hypothetical protein